METAAFIDHCRSAGGVDAYVDGAWDMDSKHGGWGVVLFCVARDRSEVHRLELSGGMTGTTNNRMEMLASIVALETMPGGLPVRLFTDSEYLRKGITSWVPRWKANGWKRTYRPPPFRSQYPFSEEIKNIDLWQRLDAVNSRRVVHWYRVPGHSGDPWNERADALAVAAKADAYKGHAPADSIPVVSVPVSTLPLQGSLL